jgi:hypothetical protein
VSNTPVKYGYAGKWRVEAPEWKGYSKSVCTREHHWSGIYGSAYYLGVKTDSGRYMFAYPNIAKHFYMLWCKHFRLDIIFASYDKNEVRKFISELGWTYDYLRTNLYVYDCPTKKYFKGMDFVREFLKGRDKL